MMQIPVPDPYPIRPELFFQYPNPIRPEVENSYPLALVPGLVDVTLGWIFNGPSLPRRRTDGVCVDKKQTCVNSRSVNHSEAI